MDIKSLHKAFLLSSGVSIDSRDTQQNTIFFALKGKRDGNLFINDALKNGANYVVSDDKTLCSTNKNFYYFKDTLQALQDLANYHRNLFKIPVIGLTGSNGKTTTKELFYSVLSQKFETFATKGNYNNHIGVPLTLLKIKKSTEIAIIEMGASAQNEISLLSNIANPTIGLITNFGDAHLEGFGSIEGVIKGKSELYTYLQQNKATILANADDKKQMELLNKYPIFSYGAINNASVNVDKEINQLGYVSIKFENTTVKSNLMGDYNFQNIASAVAIGKYFNIENEYIKKGIENYIPENNRSQFIESKRNKILLDTYNANPTSMKSALLSFFNSALDNKILILGDMLELGIYEEEKHQNIIDLVMKNRYEKVFFVGSVFYKILARNSKTNAYIFKTVDELITRLKDKSLTNKSIFIKGSRGIQLEKVVSEL